MCLWQLTHTYLPPPTYHPLPKHTQTKGANERMFWQQLCTDEAGGLHTTTHPQDAALLSQPSPQLRPSTRLVPGPFLNSHTYTTPTATHPPTPTHTHTHTLSLSRSKPTPHLRLPARHELDRYPLTLILWRYISAIVLYREHVLSVASSTPYTSIVLFYTEHVLSIASSTPYRSIVFYLYRSSVYG